MEEVHALADVIGRSTFRDRGHHDAVEGGIGLGRVAVQRDSAVEARAEQIVDRGDRRHLGGVVADRHIAAVVLEPEACWLLLAVQDVVPGLHLVGGEQVGVGQCHGHPNVEDVGSSGRPGELLDGVDLVLAAAVRVGGIDRDSVLGRESADDRPVVSPVGRQRDDVELAFLLGGGHQGVDPTQIGGRLGVGGAGG